MAPMSGTDFWMLILQRNNCSWIDEHF